MAVTKTVITSVVTRAWNEFEPKVLAFAISGITAVGVVQWADYAGVHLTSEQASLGVLIVGAIAAYIKSSSTKIAVDPPAPQLAPAPADPAAPVA
jgi:hypothetical protein